MFKISHLSVIFIVYPLFMDTNTIKYIIPRRTNPLDIQPSTMKIASSSIERGRMMLRQRIILTRSR